ncbi:hypothetical protein [Labrys monachus]|uniref:ANTAR domain-containing protein n=1 Tax=Labrys monachus TaxID=217067 RepID=A0ABU0FCR9_9HYPH|nr:hypothetical protein [Labrys monachus]MDQ0392236.1 hypothetical protein [Labrys monachus]
MSRPLSESLRGVDLSQDELVAATEQAIADCGGDARAAVMALIVLNGSLEADLAALTEEVAAITVKVSKAYARDLFYERLSRADRRSED